ncbi:MAG: peptidoglycan-binding domain-containing protein [Acidimicrobiia bacterium]|nr:peptidoglycan-binding domain-containing protein [Acidimicrobiia bacterium]
MRRQRRRLLLLLTCLLLVIGACNDDDAAPDTTLLPEETSTTATTQASTTTETTAPQETTTSSTTSTSSTTTTTTIPSTPLIARQGDRGDLVETIQWLLQCTGAEIAVDGVYGPGTAGAVEAFQADAGLTEDGIAGDNTITELSRACGDVRTLPAGEEFELFGNVAPDDPSLFSLTLLEGATVEAAVTDGNGVGVRLLDAEGTEIEPDGPGMWTVDASGEYVLEVNAPPVGTVNFQIDLTASIPEPEVGQWVIRTNGISFGDTDFDLGDDAQTVIDGVIEILGHGVRGNLNEFDTGWYEIDDPQPLGLRGLFIENLAFLFFGPYEGGPERAETLERVRYEGPSVDADGNDRPENYVTTAEGITVGDTRVELRAAYGDDVDPGSNDEEFYERFTDSGGELCFYFGADEPEDLSPIVEIATECRD